MALWIYENDNFGFGVIKENGEKTKMDTLIYSVYVTYSGGFWKTKTKCTWWTFSIPFSCLGLVNTAPHTPQRKEGTGVEFIKFLGCPFCDLTLNKTTWASSHKWKPKFSSVQKEIGGKKRKKKKKKNPIPPSTPPKILKN